MKFGARRWIEIMVTWGRLATAMMLVRTPLHFYVLRLPLGFAEAGFPFGVKYCIAHRFPLAQRGRAISRFSVAASAASISGHRGDVRPRHRRRQVMQWMHPCQRLAAAEKRLWHRRAMGALSGLRIRPSRVY